MPTRDLRHRRLRDTARWVGGVGRSALAFGLSCCFAAPALAGENDEATSTASTNRNVGVESSMWRTTTSASDYRLALARGAFHIGLQFDAPAQARADRALATGPSGQPLPVLDFGLQSVALPAGSALSALNGRSANLTTVSRVGVEWKPASQLLFFRQGIGLRLSGDDRVTMRLRKGTLGLYLKQNF